MDTGLLMDLGVLTVVMLDRPRIDSDYRCIYIHDNYARCLGDRDHYPNTLHFFWVDGRVQEIDG